MKKIQKDGLTWIIDDEIPEGQFYAFNPDDWIFNPRNGLFELKEKKDEELEI